MESADKKRNLLTRNFFLQNLLKKRETFGDGKNLEIFA
jgi:hypothetical protein